MLSQEESDKGVVFNCVDILLHFVVMSELVTFINFAFTTRCVALDYVDVRCREDLSKGVDS